MVLYYRGLAGEYLWQKEKQFRQDRLDRYKNRPWELQRTGLDTSGINIIALLGIGVLVGLLLLFSSLAG